MNRPWSLAIDTGSTYVDALLRGPSGVEHRLKHPRQGQGPAAAALAAVQGVLAQASLAPSQVGQVVHGTTIVTNALAEQRLAPAAWLTNRGFAELLRLGRQQRAELYAAVPQPRVPVTLFPPALCVEVGGRIDAAGREVEPLDPADLDRAIDRIAEGGAPAVGVGLLFSHLNPAHELAIEQRLRQRLPRLLVSLSHRVDGQAREAERYLATALDTALRPLAAAYLAELAEGLEALGLPPARLMGSDAATLPLAQAREQPLRLALSGPAAALLAAADRDAEDAEALLISMDVGGTTTDIGLVQGGAPHHADTVTVGPWQWRQRAVDIASLPIGGGSLVRALPGAALRLGPQSAGADPGPAAFGRGGKAPTLTDALLRLGRLPARLAGGLALDVDLADAALRPLAHALGSEPGALAQAVVDSAAATMAEGLKHHSFSRGLDPAQAVLLAVGGGGAQHAAEVATLLGMRRVRVPGGAGLFAAQGLLAAGEPLPAGTGARADWPGTARAGTGPAALFAPTQTVWVPAGWTWQLDDAGQLQLDRIGDD